MPDEIPESSAQEQSSKQEPFLAIDKIVERFVHQVNSLQTTLPVLMQALITSMQGEFDEINTFIASHCTRTEDGGVLVPLPVHMHYIGLQKRLDRSGVALSMVPASFLVSLVSQYDSFLGSFIRSLLYQRPELLLGSERVLTFKELNEFGSLEDAREFLVEKEVETVLRKSHQEQFEWMENKFKADEKDSFTLRKELPSWKTFIELTERRNLFVHADGVVSTQYLKVCKAAKVDCKDIEVGTQLKIDLKYFARAWSCVFEIAVKLAQVLWRKVLPSQREDADKNLAEVTYDLIVERRYSLAINLLEFGTKTLKKLSSDYYKRVLIINKAQAYKWSGAPEKASEVLAVEDWSSTSDKFLLGVMVLKDDFDSAAALMERIGSSSSPTEHSYQNWPLFKEFRKSDQFKASYEKIFGKAFTAIEEILKAPPTKVASTIDTSEGSNPDEGSGATLDAPLDEDKRVE